MIHSLIQSANIFEASLLAGINPSAGYIEDYKDKVPSPGTYIPVEEKDDKQNILYIVK